MKTLILLSLALLSSNVFAQQQRPMPPRQESPTVERAYRIADLLSRQIDRMSNQQINDIERSLDDIVGTMRGGRPPVSNGRLTCVAKDNDNANPWILGYEESPVSVVRYENVVFGSLQNCQSIIASMRPLDNDRSLFCSSKDRDGANPWQLTVFDEYSRTVSVVPASSVGSLQACSQAASDARSYGDDIAMCVSRDNDGANPWVLILYKTDGTVEKRNESFGSYAQCAAKL